MNPYGFSRRAPRTFCFVLCADVHSQVVQLDKKTSAYLASQFMGDPAGHGHSGCLIHEARLCNNTIESHWRHVDVEVDGLGDVNG